VGDDADPAARGGFDIPADPDAGQGHFINVMERLALPGAAQARKPRTALGSGARTRRGRGGGARWIIPGRARGAGVRAPGAADGPARSRLLTRSARERRSRGSASLYGASARLRAPPQHLPWRLPWRPVGPGASSAAADGSTGAAR
jgi:hypothetical protein